MDTVKHALVLVAFVGLLVVCQDKTGTNSDKSLAASKPAGGDPNAINAPIAPEAYKVTLALYGTPSLAVDGTRASYQVTGIHDIEKRRIRGI